MSARATSGKWVMKGRDCGEIVADDAADHRVMLFITGNS
jgi:cytidylate kinase